MTVPEKGRLAGIDYGTVRIGIAITDAERIIASPYEIRVRSSLKSDADYFRRFVEENRIVYFVVGLPLHLDGRLSDKAKEAMEFGAWLTETTGLGVDYMDERFTSVNANEVLREVKLTAKQRKKRIDKIAAQMLLMAYLERGCKGTTVYESID
ncbi:MAG: Holliday junction resolvase RuvX [Thermoguttaceae bacterium]|nr:Holliday junction resolvase RuvX [Thermoguttaceae bacterium]